MKQGFYNIDNYYRFHPAVKQDVKQEYRNMAFGPDKSKILSTGTRGGDIQKNLLKVGREPRVGFIKEGGKYTQTERGVKKVRGAKVLEKPKSYYDRVDNLSSESQKKLKEMANNRISKEKEAFRQRCAERDANFRKEMGWDKPNSNPTPTNKKPLPQEGKGVLAWAKKNPKTAIGGGLAGLTTAGLVAYKKNKDKKKSNYVS